jgi:hypothetical protein
MYWLVQQAETYGSDSGLLHFYSRAQLLMRKCLWIFIDESC